MFRMSTNGKNFKKVINKMVTVMPKVTYLSALKSIKLEVCGNQATAYATDGDRYIKLNIGCAWGVQDGKILLNEDNLKAISKMEKFKKRYDEIIRKIRYNAECLLMLLDLQEELKKQLKKKRLNRIVFIR